ncbi:hypothetical protein JAAARDRAFT_128431 [Jaapia argillacea MUCL 33604]|uniref:Uncharacterized protein n=1 Tax=Jaapia argillacea MUCL 33604 TaxID=933084 RepID=A0A067PV42_9AGAM|nr:hypothetical protein JAAARDRAFT_128431 [Jaapia argillacea MUCL 33604]
MEGHSSTDGEAVVFPSPFKPSNGKLPMTLVELRLRILAGRIQEKPRWWEKIFDENVVQEWKNQIIEQDAQTGKWPRERINDAQVHYIFDGLKDAATRRDKESGIETTAIPKVYQSVKLIPPDLKSAFLDAASLLEDFSIQQQTWHPDADVPNQALDVVHPSLYCYRIDESLVVKSTAGEATQVYVPSMDDYEDARPDLADSAFFNFSHSHQWLPTDFSVSSSGRMRPLGYINNIHPVAHKPLYLAVTGILQKFLPLFENVLSDCLGPELPPIIPVDPGQWLGREPDSDCDLPEPGKRDAPDIDKLDQGHRWPHIPDPALFSPSTTERRNEFKLGGRTIQVIVKIVNIFLTPESPTFSGGDWLVQGLENEQIVAIGTYCYAHSNIDQSKLEFRTAVGYGDKGNLFGQTPDSSDAEAYQVTFGLAAERPLTQGLGSLPIVEDKCIVFPNVYQHRFDPFKLADSSKPGFRKILSFFLVDPSLPILSTSKVPPQQRSWYTDELGAGTSLLNLSKEFDLMNLPVELRSMVKDYVLAETMTPEKAESERKTLTSEREHFAIENNAEIFEVPFFIPD